MPSFYKECIRTSDATKLPSDYDDAVIGFVTLGGTTFRVAYSNTKLRACIKAQGLVEPHVTARMGELSISTNQCPDAPIFVMDEDSISD